MQICKNAASFTVILVKLLKRILGLTKARMVTDTDAITLGWVCQFYSTAWGSKTPKRWYSTSIFLQDAILAAQPIIRYSSMSVVNHRERKSLFSMRKLPTVQWKHGCSIKWQNSIPTYKAQKPVLGHQMVKSVTNYMHRSPIWIPPALQHSDWITACPTAVTPDISHIARAGQLLASCYGSRLLTGNDKHRLIVISFCGGWESVTATKREWRMWWKWKSETNLILSWPFSGLPSLVWHQNRRKVSEFPLAKSHTQKLLHSKHASTRNRLW